MILIYVPVAGEEEASLIASTMVEERVAACANLVPIRSIYRWEGKTMEEGEILLILKTRKELYERCKQRIQELHSYQVPCIASLRVDEVNEAYLGWLRDETDGDDGR